MRAAIRAIVLGGSRALFLDGRTDVAAAFSDRRLRSAYAGPLARLRRSSDSAELDFGTGLPAINWTDVVAWRDALGAATAFRVKRYDQSGNSGRDLAQSTAAAQPSVILAANGFIADLYDGVNDYLRTAGFTLPQPLTVHVVARRVTTGSDPNYAWTFEGITTGKAAMTQRITPAADVSIIASGTFLNSASGGPMPTGTRAAVGAAYNGASSRLEINGATIASVSGADIGSAGLDGFTLGASGALDVFGNIEAQEAIIFNTAHSQAQMQADNAVMRAAWGF